MRRDAPPARCQRRAGRAVGDGLGYPVEQWRAGDQFVQRHRLAIPEGVSGSHTFVTGMYRLDTLEPVHGVPSTKAVIID